MGKGKDRKGGGKRNWLVYKINYFKLFKFRNRKSVHITRGYY